MQMVAGWGEDEEKGKARCEVCSGGRKAGESGFSGESGKVGRPEFTAAED